VTSPAALRVLVIGGGIGGLCLAQGLRQTGAADVTVFERDPTPAGRMQGYRLRISPEGEQGLRDCLPAPLQDLVTSTAHARLSEGMQAYDEHLNPQWAPTFTDPRGDRPDKIDAVDRGTLRAILMTGLDDVVRFGKRFTHCEQAGDRVVAYFADGDSAAGDLLVAADGVSSQVRAQLRPDDQPRDLAVRGILSRTPRAKAVEAGLPEFMQDQFSYVIGTDGGALGLMPMVFRTRPAALPGVDDYYMSVFSIHQRVLGLSDDTFLAMTGAELRDLALTRTAGWHPDLRHIWSHAEPAETYPIMLRATVPVTAWDTGNVVPLGDAAHTMPPTGGVGANTALRDASGLCAALASVAGGEHGLAGALARYQAEMVRYANEAVNMSLKIAEWSKQTTFAPAASV
jgi:2-polyprenyl-6-methoxyphenol hydroxylase-like FAD-dependent oxidoreductase